MRPLSVFVIFVVLIFSCYYFYRYIKLLFLEKRASASGDLSSVTGTVVDNVDKRETSFMGVTYTTSFPVFKINFRGRDITHTSTVRRSGCPVGSSHDMLYSEYDDFLMASDESPLVRRHVKGAFLVIFCSLAFMVGMDVLTSSINLLYM